MNTNETVEQHLKYNNVHSLILIPTPIAENKVDNITLDVRNAIENTLFFVVENLRTARRFIKAVNKSIDIDTLEFFELSKGFDTKELHAFLGSNFLRGNIGLMSEAGCPAIADPGSLVVQWCHRHKINVNPLVGPSSIILSLMASGFNGQNFAFHGYLPNKKPELITKIKWMQTQIQRTAETQIFIETPYRNRFMIETILSCIQGNEQLCVCIDLDAPTMQIINLPKSGWNAIDLDQFHKRPAVFLLGK